jgi:flagellin-specific chaperone FliS
LICEGLYRRVKLLTFINGFPHETELGEGQMEQYPETTEEVSVRNRIPAGMTKQISVAAQSYRSQQFLNLTPVEVIKKLYDVAIVACKKGDKDKAKKTINYLISGLNYDYQNISVPLYRLYQYAKYCMREGKNEEAARVLSDLRNVWTQAFHLDV